MPDDLTHNVIVIFMESKNYFHMHICVSEF